MLLQSTKIWDAGSISNGSFVVQKLARQQVHNPEAYESPKIYPLALVCDLAIVSPPCLAICNSVSWKDPRPLTYSHSLKLSVLLFVEGKPPVHAFRRLSPRLLSSLLPLLPCCFCRLKFPLFPTYAFCTFHIIPAPPSNNIIFDGFNVTRSSSPNLYRCSQLDTLWWPLNTKNSIVKVQQNLDRVRQTHLGS